MPLFSTDPNIRRQSQLMTGLNLLSTAGQGDWGNLWGGLGQGIDYSRELEALRREEEERRRKEEWQRAQAEAQLELSRRQEDRLTEDAEYKRSERERTARERVEQKQEEAKLKSNEQRARADQLSLLVRTIRDLNKQGKISEAEGKRIIARYRGNPDQAFAELGRYTAPPKPTSEPKYEIRSWGDGGLIAIDPRTGQPAGDPIMPPDSQSSTPSDGLTDSQRVSRANKEVEREAQAFEDRFGQKPPQSMIDGWRYKYDREFGVVGDREATEESSGDLATQAKSALLSGLDPQLRAQGAQELATMSDEEVIALARSKGLI